MSGEPLKCAHTVVDFITATTPWPQNLSSISDALQNYLPTLVDRVETTKLSRYGLAVYQELMDSCRSTPRIEVTGSRQTTDFIDTILSTVAILRALSALPKRDYELMSTTLCLLRILGAKCSRNGLTIGGPPFLLPRSMSADVLQKNNFEGSALLLVCASIDNNMHSSSYEDDELDSHTGTAQTVSGMKADTNSSGSRMSFTDEQLVSSMDQYPESDLTTSTQSGKAPPNSLDISLDAHVLPGRGYRTRCLLPALCVADENNINALVTAIAYQRHVWGISLPTVGICLYRASKSIFARVVAGRVEGPAEGIHLPPVRLVTSDSPFASDPSRGVYDLLSPHATLLLSQFVLSLGPDVDALYAARLPTSDCGLSWRADQTDLSSENVTTCCIKPVTPGGDCEGAIASWVRDISILVYSGKSTSPRATMPSEKAAPQRSQRSKTSDSEAPPSQRSSSKKSTNSATLSPQTEVPQKPQLGLQPPGSSTSAQTKSEAASVIAKKKLKFDMWLARRATIILAVTDIPVRKNIPKTSFQEHIGNMVPVYMSFTEPPDWDDSWPDRLMPVPSDKPYIPIRNKLVAQKNQPELTRPQHNLNEGEHASLLKERRESDDIGFEVIMSRFTVLLFAVELAQQIHAHYMETLEAGSRQPWDVIFHLACCGYDQARGYGVISGDVWPERSIRLPRPVVSSNAQMRSLLEEQRTAARGQIFAIDSDEGSEKSIAELNGVLARANENLKLFPVTSSQEILDTAGAWHDMGPVRAITDIIVSSPLVLNPQPPTDPSELPRHTKFKLLHSIAGLFKRSGRSGKTKSLTPSRSPTPVPPDFSGTENVVFFSTLGGEYKRDQNATNDGQAKNQSTIYMVSMLTYLDSLGLTDIPVFAVAGFAATGTILMAWRDVETGYNAVFRENTKTYDLTSPIEAFLFALAIHRIYRHQTELVKRLESDNARQQILLTKLNTDWFVPSNTSNVPDNNEGLGQE